MTPYRLCSKMKGLIKLQKPGNFNQNTIRTFFTDFQNARSNHVGPILGGFSRITPPNEVQFVQNFYHT